jgi:hypothetical protein
VQRRPRTSLRLLLLLLLQVALRAGGAVSILTGSRVLLPDAHAPAMAATMATQVSRTARMAVRRVMLLADKLYRTGEMPSFAPALLLYCAAHCLLQTVSCT